MSEIEISKRTAIERGGKVSAPTQWPLANNCIHGDTLHHGAGRAWADTATMIGELGRGANVSEYDPNFPQICDPMPLACKWQTVVSNYVLNVLPPAERQEVIKDIACATGEVAYVSVRSFRDHSIHGTPEQDGVRTSIGTFQKGYDAKDLLCELSAAFGHVKVIHESSGFVTAECRLPLV